MSRDDEVTLTCMLGDTYEERVERAIRLGFDYGGIGGGHHTIWVIDQMLRTLLD